MSKTKTYAYLSFLTFKNSTHLSVRNFLKVAVLFVQTHTDISRKDIELIFHCHRLLLFDDINLWVKKDRNDDFNFTMRNFEKVCELAGLFMLNELLKKFNKDSTGLYRSLIICI